MSQSYHFLTSPSKKLWERQVSRKTTYPKKPTYVIFETISVALSILPKIERRKTLFKRRKLKNQRQQRKEASFFVDEQSLEIYSLQSVLRRYPEGRLGCLFEGILHGQLFFVSTLCTQLLTVQYPYYDVIRGCMLGKNVISGQVGSTIVWRIWGGSKISERTSNKSRKSYCLITKKGLHSI